MLTCAGNGIETRVSLPVIINYDVYTTCTWYMHIYLTFYISSSPVSPSSSLYCVNWIMDNGFDYRPCLEGMPIFDILQSRCFLDLVSPRN